MGRDGFVLVLATGLAVLGPATSLSIDIVPGRDAELDGGGFLLTAKAGMGLDRAGRVGAGVGRAKGGGGCVPFLAALGLKMGVGFRLGLECVEEDVDAVVVVGREIRFGRGEAGGRGGSWGVVLRMLLLEAGRDSGLGRTVVRGGSRGGGARWLPVTVEGWEEEDELEVMRGGFGFGFGRGRKSFFAADSSALETDVPSGSTGAVVEELLNVRVPASPGLGGITGTGRDTAAATSGTPSALLYRDKSCLTGNWRPASSPSSRILVTRSRLTSCNFPAPRLASGLRPRTGIARIAYAGARVGSVAKVGGVLPTEASNALILVLIELGLDSEGSLRVEDELSTGIDCIRLIPSSVLDGQDGLPQESKRGRTGSETL